MSRLALVAAAALLSSGCLGPATIRIPAPSPLVEAKASGAETRGVKLTVIDLRLGSDPPVLSRAVARQVGQCGQGAEISNEEPVPVLMERTVKAKWVALGYSVREAAPVQLTVEIMVFENRFYIGTWSGESQADVGLGLVVRDSVGREILPDAVSVRYVDGSAPFFAEKAQSCLGFALRDAMKALVDKQSLHEYLARTTSR
jgi:uncharacterized lipoprotein YajG